MICISMVKIRILYIWAIKGVNDSKCVSGHQPFVFLNLALTMTQCESSLSGRLQLQGPTTTGGMCNTLAVKKLRWPRGSQWVEAARGAVGRWLRTHRLCWQWMLMQRCQSNVCWVKALKQKRQSWEWCKFFKKRHTHTYAHVRTRTYTHTQAEISHITHWETFKAQCEPPKRTLPTLMFDSWVFFIPILCRLRYFQRANMMMSRSLYG